MKLLKRYFYFSTTSLLLASRDSWNKTFRPIHFAHRLKPLKKEQATEALESWKTFAKHLSRVEI